MEICARSLLSDAEILNVALFLQSFLSYHFVLFTVFSVLMLNVPHHVPKLLFWCYNLLLHWHKFCKHRPISKFLLLHIQFSFRFGWFFFSVFVWILFFAVQFYRSAVILIYIYFILFFRFPIISSIVVILPVLINAWYKINWMKRKTTTTTITEKKKRTYRQFMFLFVCCTYCGCFLPTDIIECFT